MTRRETSIEPDYFERMFQGDDDPWDLDTSPYEAAKYDHSLRALGSRRHQYGFEVGCARGALTQRLADHCSNLLAIDVSFTALAAARARCVDRRNVSFEQMIFPSQAPSGMDFDLIVLSEVIYYWDDQDLARAASWIIGHLRSGGDLLLVHWIGETDYPQCGDGAVAKLAAGLGDIVEMRLADRTKHYRLDLWRRRP